MAEATRAPIVARSIGTFQLRLTERWSMITFIGLVLLTFTAFEMWGFAGGEFWFLMFILSALVFVPVILGITQGQMDIFEPIFLVCAAYFLYFVWAPTYDWIRGNFSPFGIDIVSGIWRGTMHAIVGVASMLVGYYVNFGGEKRRNPMADSKSTYRPTPEHPVDLRRASEANKYAIGLIIGAIVCLGLTFKLTGWNWSRLLTFGQLGDEKLNIWLIEQNPFLNYLHSTMEWFLPAFLVLMVFRRPSPRSRFFLSIAFLAVFAIYTTLGFRYRVLLLMMAPVVYWYMTKRKRPGVMGIVVAAVVTILMVSIIGGTRGATRAGGDIERQDIALAQSGNNFTQDLRIYPPFYRMLDVYPIDYDYIWGSSYLYVFISPIPRALWPGKPDAPVRNVLRVILGERAVTAGLAYPNLGEFYVNFGLVGEILGMFLFGFILRRIWMFLQRNAHDPWALILYSMTLPFLVQVVSRGYFVQIAQEIAFIFGPIVLGRYFLGERAPQSRPKWIGAPARPFGFSQEIPSR
jgi:oligosaccharide repeat unit polymerase